MDKLQQLLSMMDPGNYAVAFLVTLAVLTTGWAALLLVFVPKPFGMGRVRVRKGRGK